jgi:hypothetical protein
METHIVESLPDFKLVYWLYSLCEIDNGRHCIPASHGIVLALFDVNTAYLMNYTCIHRLHQKSSLLAQSSKNYTHVAASEMSEVYHVHA